MKIDFVKFLITTGISALIAFACYSLSKEESTPKMILTSGSFLFLAFTACFMAGIDYANRKSGLMLKILSSVFFFAGIVLHVVFALLPFNLTVFIITDGILLLIFLGGLNFMYKSKV
jgi:hypothetical protein